MTTFWWSIRRELWENRSIYIAPLAVAVLVLVGFFVGLAAGPAERGASEQPFVMAALILMAVDIIVAVFYCLDALYGERRDRSVLFWKSLPVSDTTSVLAKAAIPIVVLPLVTFAATVLAQGVMLAAGSAPPSLSLLEIVRTNFGHLVALHGIWYAPLYGWLLLVSAWATRLPFLWAVLPPALVIVIERITFNTSSVARALQGHFLGGPPGTPADAGASMSMAVMAPHPGHLIASPGLWIALALTAVFLFGAIRLRRSRGAL